MAAKALKLMVFAHLGQDWAPCGQLLMTEQGLNIMASSFAYGLNCLRRIDTLEVEPVSLVIQDRTAVPGKRLLPAKGLPESQYLLHAGSDRVGALDIRESIHDSPTPGNSGTHALEHLMDAAERIEAGLPIPVHLEAIFMYGTALGGARPKASVRDEHGVLWLAKFSSRHDGFDIPAIECAALRLAAAAGLTVPYLIAAGRTDATPSDPA